MPFSIRPRIPLTPRALAGVLRNHYEGTAYAGSPPLSAHQAHTTPVCRPGTNSSSIFQLRPTKPRAVGAVWWLALWQPCSSPYVPVYCGIDTVPSALAFGAPSPDGGPPGSAGLPSFGPAYRLFGKLARWVDADYQHRHPRVARHWMALERVNSQLQRPFEEGLCRHWEKNPDLVRAMLTRYVAGAWATAVDQATNLLSAPRAAGTPRR